MKDLRSPGSPAPPAKRCTILANPASGDLPFHRRYGLLKRAAAILGAEIHGLDTASVEDYVQCARERARRSDLLVVAGGDGSFSLVMNSIDLHETPLAFLPFGTGNALTHALGYRGGMEEIAARLRRAPIHRCDLIDCDGRQKAFMASLGIDGCAIRLYEMYKGKGHRGLGAHLRAGLRAVFREYRATGGRIEVDGEARRVRRLYSLMVVKQPYFGMGLEVMPGARWSDGLLHSRTITSGAAGIAAGLISGFTIGNRVGAYRSGAEVAVSLEAPLTLQIDGEPGWTSDRFRFKLIPAVLRLKY
jgi:diacylglycerol kinase family enzyme